jgi:polyisoprenoid-binding protein YceI
MPPSAAGFALYVTDARASQFTVQAFANGLIAAVAHSPKIAIREWTVEVRFDPATLATATLRATAKTASFEVLDEMRDSDKRELQSVMNKEVLETARFPEVVFESSQITIANRIGDACRADAEGLLSLHGVTRAHSFSAQVAFGVESFRAYGEFKLRQTDYNIRIASIAGGTLKLQDELKFTFYIVARQQAGATA